MRPECVAAVAQAIGREPTAEEVSGYEAGIEAALRQLRREQGADFLSTPVAERLQAAAERAAQDLLEQAKRAREQTAQRIVATQRAVARVQQLHQGGEPVATALGRFLEQADVYGKGVSRDYFSRLVDTIRAAEPRFFGLLQDAASVRDFVREVRGEASGNATAAKGAKAWLETVEAMRQRFNRAGGDIGQLDYGYLPQPHDMARVAAAGREGWVADVLPRLDHARYLRADGGAMSQAELVQFLAHAYDTISSNGVNKLEPGHSGGVGARVNRHAESRQIHFRDADAYLGYMERFGRGSVFEAMQGHVSVLARDIALVEQMGPNPEHLFRYLDDLAIKADGRRRLIGPFAVRAKDLWSVLSGFTSQTAHQRLGDIAQGVRNYTVAAKLQGTLLSSITDIPTLALTARYNRLPVLQTFANVLRSFGAETGEYANRAGLVADSVISDMNRWAEGNLGHNWTGKLANTTMRVSLMNAWTDALRRGFSVTLMGALGKLSRIDWDALPEADRAHLARKGVTAADWKLWRLAQPEVWRGAQMLTPEAVRAIPDARLDGVADVAQAKDAAVAKLLGVITDESEYAVVSPDLMTRAALTRSTQKGEALGEITRSVALFKSFPLAMISRHLRRAAQMPDTAGALGYAASLIAGLAAFGAASLTAKDIVTGKDPRPMDSGKFWAAALVQGGGLGIYGDILYTGMGGQTRGGQANWTSLMGPVFGTGADLLDVTLGNLGQGLQGKDPHAAAELLRFSRQNLPFVNLWYARAALDHAVFHEMQEALSPGYLAKMRQRAARDWGQRFWWEPGEALPSRAPDFEAALGE
ncbi:MAG: hypothetical protein IT518_20275 [Burkholderiales bacterium]|nr:hypothetical protein [Burkholderiales bacterium]